MTNCAALSGIKLSTSALDAAASINAALGYSAPGPATKANGWFGGYGCRWCQASLAMFVVVPFGFGVVADQLAQAFRTAGFEDVTVGREAGEAGIQVSAYAKRFGEPAAAVAGAL